jgi:NADH-quinone oxidoreductase subunit N
MKTSTFFVFAPELVILGGISVICFVYTLNRFSEFRVHVFDKVFYSFALFILFLYTFISCYQILFIDDISIQGFEFNSMFWIDEWVFLVKVIFGYLAFCVTYSHITTRYEAPSLISNLRIFESVVLVQFAVFGMSICLSANNLVILYLALELQSFCIFILLFLDANTSRMIYASITYFLSVLVSSIFLLTGISYVYWRFGSLDLSDIWLSAYSISEYRTGFDSIDTIGVSILILGLFVKVGLFPMHLWVPEVYTFGGIFPVSLIATISKLFGFVVLMHLFLSFSFHITLLTFFSFVAVCAIIHGTISALTQTSRLSLLGYSAVAHVGYMFLVVSSGTPDAYGYAFFYLVIYLFNLVPVFIFLMTVYRVDSDGLKRRLTNVSDFASVRFRDWPEIGNFLLFSTFFFSLIGIPPFSGFFSKFYVIFYLFYSNHFFLAFIMGLFSVISAFYYLKIIKSMFFEPRDLTHYEGVMDSDVASRDSLHSHWIVPTSTKIFILIFGLVNLCFIFLFLSVLNLSLSIF